MENDLENQGNLEGQTDEKEESQNPSKTGNAFFWLLAIIAIFINLIPDAIDVILNILNLSGIALIFVMPFVVAVNSAVGFVTFLLLLIIGSLDFRPIAKRFITYAIGYLVEYIPFIGILPLRTVTVLISIFLTVAEEKTGKKIQKK